MLELKNITKRFAGKLILDGVNLTVNDGQILTIVGPSGAGKTTLLRCISGLEETDSGDFFLDGQPLNPVTKRNTILQAVAQFLRHCFQRMAFRHAARHHFQTG